MDKTFMHQTISTSPSPRSKKRGRISTRSFLFALILIVAAIALIAGPAIPTKILASRLDQKDQLSTQGVSPSASLQIQALEDEKETRTPVQAKIDSQLLYALKMERAQPNAAALQSLQVDVGESEQGRVVVDISATVDDKLLQALANVAASVVVSTPEYHSIRVEVGLDRLEEIALSESVRFIQPKQDYVVGGVIKSRAIADDVRSASAFPARAQGVRAQLVKALNGSQSNSSLPSSSTSTGSFHSEGDVTHRADTARGTFHTDGTGVKIGVLSDGVVSLDQSQALGELGPVTVLPGQLGRGDEGTAILEVSSAIDIQAPGVDRDSGNGIIMAYQALQAAGATGTANLQVGSITVTEVGGNGNGFVEPGEQGTATVQLLNTGINAATGISATLVSNTPGVFVTPPGASAYPDIPATTGAANNAIQSAFSVSSTAPCPSNASFTLLVTYSGGPNPLAIPVNVVLSQTVTINETLDNPTPPVSNSPLFTAATGTQRGRLVRTGFWSLCSQTKANPGLNDTTPNRRFDSYTFSNPTNSPICIGVTLNTAETQLPFSRRPTLCSIRRRPRRTTLVIPVSVLRRSIIRSLLLLIANSRLSSTRSLRVRSVGRPCRIACKSLAFPARPQQPLTGRRSIRCRAHRR